MGSESSREEGQDRIVYTQCCASTLPANYRPLIFAKWLRSLRYGNDYFKLINAQDYYAAYTHYISRVLALPGAVVRLAVLGSDRDIVLGFAVIRGQILEYVHVHKDHRRAGIATKLVPQNVTAITHLTRTALTIWGTGKRPWKFNPFA